MRIYYGEIVYDSVNPAHHDAVVSFALECGRRGIVVERGVVVGDALVSRSRSIAASAFLRSKADVLLTIDSDIWFKAADAIKLCEEALEYDFVAGLYLTRGLKKQSALLLPQNIPVIFQEDSKPVEVRYISTGFMAVSRKGLEKTLEHSQLPHCHKGMSHLGQDTSFFPLYMPFCVPDDGPEETLYLSEDWALCERAKRAGFKMWLDPSIRLGHVGSEMYTLEELLRPPKPEPQPLKLIQKEGQLVVYAADKGEKHPLIQSLPGDIAEYFKLTSEEVAAVMVAGTIQMANLWRDKPPKQTELEFYQRDDVGTAYVTDLAQFTTKMGGHLTSQLKDIEGRYVLDFGSGIGTHALMLASQGCTVECVEVNQVMRDFTEWRAGKHGLNIKFVDKPGVGYDVALCFHVLEHVPNPQEIANLIINSVLPEGRIFTESDFEDDGAHPMHHVDKTNRRGEKFWMRCNLIDMWWWEKPKLNLVVPQITVTPNRAQRRRMSRAGV